jgi:molybdenum cofactor cytidylyltransferase
MKFGKITVAEAEGAILAHSLKIDGLSFKKGRLISSKDVAQLASAGIESLVAARLEVGDIDENEAASRIANAITGAGVTATAAFTGRVNLIASGDGLVTFDAEAIGKMNLIDEAVTIATAAPLEHAAKNKILATIKIIPYGVSENIINACVETARKAKASISLTPFAAKKVALAQTTLPGIKDSVFVKTREVTRSRVEGLGSTLLHDAIIAHTETEVAESVISAKNTGVDILLIAGASAITDRRDVIPAGIVEAGGEIIHCGMPVDPGNLLLVGVLEGMSIIGLPGCARSPKFNGIDLVLRRLVANLPVTSREIMSMGIGGLLKEFANRPSPRAADRETLPSNPVIAGLILAAGQSRRMGKTNKLLAQVDGQAMVTRVAETVSQSSASPVSAVTGHQAEKVRQALTSFNFDIVHNPRYAEGISSSLQRGIAALPQGIDGVVVCLGDMPRVTTKVIDKLIAAFNPLEQRAICIPTWQGKRGNPVLLASRFFSEINDIAGDVGARGLLGAYPELVCEVEMDDDGVLLDIDTPQALESMSS